MAGLYTPDVLSGIYESNGLFARCVDMPAEDAAFSGFELEGISNRSAEYYRKQLELFNWEDIAANAIRWQRLFGGAVVVVLADDGGGIEEPLQLNALQRVDGLLLFDSAHVRPIIDQDGKPESFTVQSGAASFSVHGSRCLLFRSDTLPELADDEFSGFWGATLFERIQQALQTVATSQGAPGKILNRVGESVLKIDHMTEKLSTEQGEAVLLNQMLLFDLCRGLFSTALLDMADDYRTAPAPGALTEAAALINQAWETLSAASGIPIVILAGSPLPDTGSKVRAPMQKGSDHQALKEYQSFIRGLQIRSIKRPLLRLLEIIGRAGFAAGALDTLEFPRIKWRPLYPASPMEAAENDLKAAQAELARAQAMQHYLNIGALSTNEIKNYRRINR